MMRRREHDVVTATSSADALALMQRQCFDAVVMECVQDPVEILNFTAKACGLQPWLAVFLAEEWGDELASGLEELSHRLRILGDDELAMLRAESRTV